MEYKSSIGYMLMTEGVGIEIRFSRLKSGFEKLWRLSASKLMVDKCRSPSIEKILLFVEAIGMLQHAS